MNRHSFPFELIFGPEKGRLEGKGKLHFVPEKVKVNADFYVNDRLPKLIEDCESLLSNNFVFQQDGAPAHSSRLAQEWFERHSPEL